MRRVRELLEIVGIESQVAQRRLSLLLVGKRARVDFEVEGARCPASRAFDAQSVDHDVRGEIGQRELGLRTHRPRSSARAGMALQPRVLRADGIDGDPRATLRRRRRRLGQTEPASESTHGELLVREPLRVRARPPGEVLRTARARRLVRSMERSACGRIKRSVARGRTYGARHDFAGLGRNAHDESGRGPSKTSQAPRVKSPQASAVVLCEPTIDRDRANTPRDVHTARNVRCLARSDRRAGAFVARVGVIADAIVPGSVRGWCFGPCGTRFPERAQLALRKSARTSADTKSATSTIRAPTSTRSSISS